MSRHSGRVVVLNGLLALVMLVSALGPLAGADGGEGGASPRASSYMLSIIPVNATKWVDASTPQKSATYGFQVKNTGDSSLPLCDLQLYPWNFPPDKWSYNFIPSTPFEVNSLEVKNVLLVIYPAADAEAKRYTFQLRGKGTTQVTNSISVNLDVRQYADVLIKAPAPQEAVPGATLEFNFEIQNIGNGKDKFYIDSVDASIASIQPALKDGNNLTLDLASGKSVIKSVLVQLPHDTKTTEGSAGYQLSMTVHSMFNNSQDDVNWTLIGVRHIYDLSMGVSPPSVKILPGVLAEFTVTILNLGNGNDVIGLNLTSNFDSSAWTVSMARSIFHLPAGRINSTVLKITPPLNALRGANYQFEVIARSSGPLFPDTPVERSEVINIEVLQVPIIFVPRLEFVAPQPIGPGQVVRFPFNFTNRGNGEDLVNITVLERPVGWYTTLDFFQNIRMQPFTTQDVSLTVQSSINRNESLHQSYFVRLQLGNAGRTSVYNLSFEIPIDKVYEWEFIVQEPTKGTVNPYALSKQSFTLSFTNTGNVGDEIELSLSGDYAAWGKLDTTALSLAYGEHKTVRLEVDVPKTADVSREYGLRIVATSLNNPNLQKDFAVSVVVIHHDLSVVPADSIEIDGNVWKDFKTTQGTRLNITVTLRNDGTDSVKQVNVKFYDNDVLFAEKNSTTVGPLKNAKFTVQWEASTLGLHIIRVKLDANSQYGEANEDNNEGVCTVIVNKYVPPPKETQGINWLYPLILIVAVVGAAGGGYFIYSRRPKYDKELYESIYGRQASADTERQLLAERAEVERRAREKGEEGYVPSPLYESSTHEEVYSQPSGESEGAPVSGPALDLAGAGTTEPAGSPAEPAAPGATPVLKPTPKKKISIRPVEKK
ncbi:MAG: hypothetical protein FJ149_06140 [Euryarchaeota archaeon]|nr:hypothetical protein [Euryarchaeota archaeon]